LTMRAAGASHFFMGSGQAAARSLAGRRRRLVWLIAGGT
jgi:hypothetical protein